MPEEDCKGIEKKWKKSLDWSRKGAARCRNTTNGSLGSVHMLQVASSARHSHDANDAHRLSLFLLFSAILTSHHMLFRLDVLKQALSVVHIRHTPPQRGQLSLQQPRYSCRQLLQSTNLIGVSHWLQIGTSGTVSSSIIPTTGGIP